MSTVSREIETTRLSLYPVEAADVDAVHALLIDPGVRRFLMDDVVITRDRAREMVDASVVSFETRGFGLWVVRALEDERFVGVAELRPVDDEVELLMAIAPSHWRRGLGREAARAVLAFAFARARLPRVIAQADPPNTASIRLMEALGMRRLGEVQQGALTLVRYAIEAPVV